MLRKMSLIPNDQPPPAKSNSNKALENYDIVNPILNIGKEDNQPIEAAGPSIIGSLSAVLNEPDPYDLNLPLPKPIDPQSEAAA